MPEPQQFSVEIIDTSMTLMTVPAACILGIYSVQGCGGVMEGHGVYRDKD